MIDGELTAIEARCNAATPGPWDDDDGEIIDSESSTVARITFHGNVNTIQRLRETYSIRDGAFIAHARTDVPALIDEVKRLRAQNERLNMRLSKAFKVGADCCRRMQLEEK